MTDDWTFVDTNVLVYAYDTSADSKNKIAAEIIGNLWHSGMGVISTQVLQEFYDEFKLRISFYNLKHHSFKLRTLPFILVFKASYFTLTYYH